MSKKFKTAAELLSFLNARYSKVHTAYENAFWISQMGDHTRDALMAKSQAAREKFRSDPELSTQVDIFLKKSKGKMKSDLLVWKRFFLLYQTPKKLLDLRREVSLLEAEILTIQTTRKEGYRDPETAAFVEASENKMKTILSTHPDEAVRKACFDALNKLPFDTLDKYVELIGKRNTFAQRLGYEDFYAYKLDIDEKMSKEELFSIFDRIYDATKYAFKDLRDLERSMPGLRKPWNFSYMMTGNFTKEEDPYFGFESALSYWGRSFAALGVDFAGGKLTLDLLDRKGKYNNGFCHWPETVRYEKGRRIPGKSNFTCNAIPGQIGSGIQGLHTLFHEGGHAAHLLNTTEKQVCLNTEFPPQSVSWAETQSMFMDTIMSSVEWKTRYAKTADGAPYPFDLFERKIRKLHPLRPLGMMSMLFVCEYERRIYECANLTKEFVLETARAMYRKYFDKSEDYLLALNIPHIYAWESSAYYHGYALAELGVEQWREYFYEKYGHIVDNPNVGREMKRVWKYGSRYSSGEFIKKATGKELNPDAFLKNATLSAEDVIIKAKKRIRNLEKVPMYNGPVKLDAGISLVHGKEKIADNGKSFEDMDAKYRMWLEKIKK